MEPDTLPPALAERVRPLSRGRLDGPFVLVWLRAALRAEENPVLDVAALVADHLRVPVVVYQGLSERYPHASDRHHTFILEAASELHPRLRARGFATALHVERPGHRGPHLKTLAERAALVLTEDVPVDPLRGWTRRLAAATSTPVWAVDTACVVPMQLLGGPPHRAYAFRDRQRALLEARVERPWEDHDPAVRGELPDLPFTPVELTLDAVPELVAACEIDHDVAPVPHTRGGTTAGLDRWQAFLDDGLAGYARRRNDPLRSGTSRMSPYLHHGMVAPTRLARDAADRGASKFLDELVVWRELAWTWCATTETHDTLDALPGWARATLLRHASDPRPRQIPADDLDAARSGEPLWDTAQRSLLRHGELHNNVRMTWGKALLGWTPDPAEALRLCIHLNHRYALDGRDPASYGGILWCFGLFDRPFDEAPVRGTVRGRSLRRHAERLDVERWARHVDRPLTADAPTQLGLF